MSTILRGSSWQTLTHAQNEVNRELPKEVRKRLIRIGGTYIARYGVDGWYERFNGRSVATILSEFNESDALEPLASGKVGDVGFALYGPPEGSSGDESFRPPFDPPQFSPEETSAVQKESIRVALTDE